MQPYARKLLWIAPLLSVGAAAYGQYEDEALQKMVSAFRCPAAPASKSLELLSAASGVKLMTSAQTGSESLFLNVTDVKLADLMKQIAAATSGDWRREEGGYRLIRPTAVASQEANAERMRRLETIRKAIQKKTDALKPKPAAKPNEPNAAPDVQFGPFSMGAGSIDRAITKLLALSDANVIAALESGGRAVFSSSPTRMQRPFFGDVTGIVAELVQAHNRSVSQRANDPDMSDEDRKALEEFLGELGIAKIDKPVDSRPAKVLLVVSRGGGAMAFGGGMSLHLVLFDSNGKTVLSGQSFLDDGNSLFAGMIAEPAQVEGAQPKQEPKLDARITGPDGPIEFSKTTKEITSLFGGDMMAGMASLPERLTPELKDRLLRPDLYDPLSFAESNSLDSIAKIKGLDVVANLPDSRIGGFGGMLGSTAKSTVNQYLQSIFTDARVAATVSGTWLLAKPGLPIASRIERVDRVSLAALLAATRAHGLPRLDDYAVYAQKNESPFTTPASILYLMLFAPNAMSGGVMGMTDWDVMRFYGSLNPSQRLAMRNGTQTVFLNLDPGQRRLVERMLYGANHNLTVGPVPTDDLPQFMTMMRGMMGSQVQEWKQEPTEIMPIGLPNDGRLLLSMSESMVAQMKGENQMATMMGALGPSELAFFHIMKEDPQFSSFGAAFPPLNELRLGNRKTYRFQFVVAPDVTTTRTLNDDAFDKNAPIVSYDNLPASFKESIEKQAKAIKSSPIWKMMSMGIGRSRSADPPRH